MKHIVEGEQALRDCDPFPMIACLGVQTAEPRLALTVLSFSWMDGGSVTGYICYYYSI